MDIRSLAKKPAKLIAIVGGALVLLWLVISYISFYDEAVELENATLAQYEQNKNNYDKLWKSIQEMAQVPDKYKDDFQEVLVGNTSARYGPSGSQATMQWLREHAIRFDDTQYNRLMTAIEGGRRDFEGNQKLLLDVQRRYRDHLGSFFGRGWASIGGFPKPVAGELAPSKDRDADGKLTALDYPIVTSGRTQEAFAAGEDEAIDVFPEK